MKKNPNLENTSNMLEAWGNLSETVLEKIGTLSIRTLCLDDGSYDILHSDSGDTVFLLNQTQAIDNFMAAFNGMEIDEGTDVITVNTGVIVSTNTRNCIEYDTHLHRRADTLGNYLETEVGLTLNQDLSMATFDIPEDTALFHTSDAVSILLHAENAESVIPLTYQGSFEFDAGDLPEDIILDLDEDDEDGRLVCDLHHGGGGFRSITISQHATTPDGPLRRVIFNDLRV